MPTPYAARRTVFNGDLLSIGHVVRRGPSHCGELEQQEANVVVFPLQGVFAKHTGARRQVLGTPSHAMLIGAGEPYRVSFPGGIGEECMTLRFSREQLDARTVAPHALLSARALIMRTILWDLVRRPECDPLEVEEIGLGLLATVQHTAEQHSARIERVKEAIAVEPERRWTLSALAELGGASRYHLARIFREEVGVTVHRYVTRARLALALPRVLDADDLTAIALDTGFSSHSHFTARFRSVFGMTPSELRKILTAPGARHRVLLPA
ncbi:MAG TPA: AraC family transcriptional regulator [Burkholderiales bacterium]|nr:AraC family transcriptional regulator [Burkholderiales bacterium]